VHIPKNCKGLLDCKSAEKPEIIRLSENKGFGWQKMKIKSSERLIRIYLFCVA
jgi:hypothetical protein